MSDHRCEALTSRGTRCRRKAQIYFPLSREREVCLCPEHQRHAYERRLRMNATKR